MEVEILFSGVIAVGTLTTLLYLRARVDRAKSWARWLEWYYIE